MEDEEWEKDQCAICMCYVEKEGVEYCDLCGVVLCHECYIESGATCGDCE